MRNILSHPAPEILADKGLRQVLGYNIVTGQCAGNGDMHLTPSWEGLALHYDRCMIIFWPKLEGRHTKYVHIDRKPFFKAMLGIWTNA